MSRCSQEAWLRYAMGQTSIEEQAPLLAGSAAHSAVALHWKGRSLPVALAAFDSQYREWAEENVGSEDKLSYANTRRILRRYLKKNPVSKLPFRILPETIETRFRVPLDDAGEFLFAGQIDVGACEWEDAEDVFPVDTKTTGSISEFFKERWWMDSQLTGYMWAFSVLHGRKVRHAYINAIQFSRLPSADNRRCREHGCLYSECGVLHARFEVLGPYSRSERQLEDWRRTAIELAKRYRALVERYPEIAYARQLKQEGLFHGHCAYCFAKQFCRADRKLGNVKVMLREEPWEVIEG